MRDTDGATREGRIRESAGEEEQEEGREETPCQGRTNPAEEEGGSKEGIQVLPPQG